MKIKVNVPGFGERFCSDNVEYEINGDCDCYLFYKKGTDIRHNEYGPAVEWKDGSYLYFINDKHHRLSDHSYDYMNYKSYNIIGKQLRTTKEDFIKNLANALIPKSLYFL